MKSIIYCVILLCCGAFGLLESKEANCTRFQKAFAVQNSNFIHCGIQNAEPVHFCRKCVDPYINSTTAFNTLLTGVYLNITTNMNMTCKSIFFDKDRLNLVQRMYDFSNLLWNTAACSNCFTIDNGTLTNETSGVASTFFYHLEDHRKCIEQSMVDKNDTCIECAGQYEKLNDNFNQIKKNFGESLCFDIVDAMNRTRFEWSNVLKCCKDRNTSTTAFIAVSTTIGCLPVLFYLVFFIVTSRRERSEYISAAVDSENEVDQPLDDPLQPLPSTSVTTQIESNAKPDGKYVNTGSESSDGEMYQPPKKLE